MTFWTKLYRLGLAAGAVSTFGAFTSLACSAEDRSVDDFYDEAVKSRDAAADSHEDEDAAEDVQAPSDEQDAGTQNVADDGADSAHPCQGKADGYSYDANDQAARCCGEVEVRFDSATNCGGCGISCGKGLQCGSPAKGQWGCHCTSNTGCVTAGYGAGATCYTLSGQSYCNCQCPGGAATCSGVCKGGGTCHDVEGQNYCATP